MTVNLSVREHTTGTTPPIFAKHFWECYLLWWHRSKLGSCGFMDDVMFSHNGQE